MNIIYNDTHYAHDPQYEIYDGVKESYAEKAARMTSLVAALRASGRHEFREPRTFGLEPIAALHIPEYISFLEQRAGQLDDNAVLYPSYFMMDTYTPIVAGTFKVAKNSADIALTGAECLLSGEKSVYSLCRPPGHHAAANSTGGYCYFNNAAIAANYLAQHGKVAILDIDFHHGNGTQGFFYDRDDVLFVSIHADPAVKFPYISGYERETGAGAGLGYTINYPLQPGTTNDQYRAVLTKAIADVRRFAPDFLVVSTGFDTYEHDPIGGFKITAPFYTTIGADIAALQLPTLLIQEGGYNAADLGTLAANFLDGFEAAKN